ncbi:hypothetical protein [Escherichia coli]|uniref:hypothetical protein n=1 Tax=Escherichia coli TaxID=562 RepID=UPI0020233980|nr:hypothetical protein [Escherichia coli]
MKMPVTRQAVGQRDRQYWKQQKNERKIPQSTVSFLRAFVRAMNQGMGVHELKSNVSGASQAKAQIELLLKELEL